MLNPSRDRLACSFGLLGKLPLLRNRLFDLFPQRLFRRLVDRRWPGVIARAVLFRFSPGSPFFGVLRAAFGLRSRSLGVGDFGLISGKLRSLPVAPWPAFGWGGLTPTSFPTSTPTSFPTRWGCVPLASLVERIGAGQVPFVGPVSRKNRG